MSAIDDYLQLLNNNPKADTTGQWLSKLGNNVKTGIEDSLPKGVGPTAMLDYASANNPISHVASMLGSIRLPSDIVKPMYSGHAEVDSVARRFSPRHDTVIKRYSKYLNKDWATDTDPFVKMLNEGQDITGPITRTQDGTRSNNYSAIPNNFINDQFLFNQIRPAKIDINQARLGIPEGDRLKLDSNYTSGRPLGVTLDLLKNNRGTKRFNAHVDSLNDVMNQMRETRGTNAIGQTRAAKYFEDINDLNAVSTLVNPKNPRVKDIVNSDYYKNSVDKPAIFTPKIDNYRFGQFSHMADVIPQTDRMSLIDSVRHAISADDAAIVAAKYAKENAGKSAAFNKKELVHQFDDGTSWNKISHSDALKAEGEYQGHCVGTYCNKVSSGNAEIYSLRDAKNTPLLTAEYDPHTRKMVQVKGRFNASPGKELNSKANTLKNLLEGDR